MANNQTLTEIEGWRNAALIQVVAESFLQGKDLKDPNAVGRALLSGNTPPAFDNDSTAQQFIRFAGKQGEPTQQLTDFLARFEIIDQHADDGTGFSATLLRERATGQLTLAFRSTEYKSPVSDGIGGDYDRDGFFGADGEVEQQGYAFAQILAMQRYWERLQQGLTDVDPANKTERNLAGNVDGALRSYLQNAANKIDVVGYSLGANLASVFTVRNAERVNRSIVFNAAGIGRIDNVPEAQLGAKLDQVLATLKLALENPLAVSLVGIADPEQQRRLVDEWRRHD